MSADDSDAWIPRKKKPTATFACDQFSEGVWLDGAQLVFLLHVFRLSETDATQAFAYDNLLIHIETQMLTAMRERLADMLIKAADAARSADIPWQCHIINTDRAGGAGCHWNLAMWCVRSGRLRFVLWEPYDTGRYSDHIEKAVKASCERVWFKRHLVGEQKRGDGWSCGYICVWWQIVVQKLIADNNPPIYVENPAPVPVLWPGLVWTALRLFEKKWEVYGMLHLDATLAEPVRALVAPEWQQVVANGHLSRRAVKAMKASLDKFRERTQVHSRQSMPNEGSFYIIYGFLSRRPASRRRRLSVLLVRRRYRSLGTVAVHVHIDRV